MTVINPKSSARQFNPQLTVVIVLILFYSVLLFVNFILLSSILSYKNAIPNSLTANNNITCPSKIKNPYSTPVTFNNTKHSEAHKLRNSIQILNNLHAAYPQDVFILINSNHWVLYYGEPIVNTTDWDIFRLNRSHSGFLWTGNRWKGVEWSVQCNMCTDKDALRSSMHQAVLQSRSFSMQERARMLHEFVRTKEARMHAFVGLQPRSDPSTQHPITSDSGLSDAYFEAPEYGAETVYILLH